MASQLQHAVLIHARPTFHRLMLDTNIECVYKHQEILLLSLIGLLGLQPSNMLRPYTRGAGVLEPALCPEALVTLIASTNIKSDIIRYPNRYHHPCTACLPNNLGGGFARTTRENGKGPINRVTQLFLAVYSVWNHDSQQKVLIDNPINRLLAHVLYIYCFVIGVEKGTTNLDFIVPRTHNVFGEVK